MAIDRRTFVAGVTSLFAAPLRAADVVPTIIASTALRPDGSFMAVLYDLDRGLLNSVSLPARGHDVAVNRVTRDAVAFARRPGTFAVVFCEDRNRSPIAFTTPPGRHFYGHGVFSADGRLLYTTENDVASGGGRIGVWDTTVDYRRVGEFSSHGLGPHDVNLLSDGRTLVVANGGIITHPDHGRQPLNIATMRPSLAYIDGLSGNLVEQQTLPPQFHKLSIRHLDVAAHDTVIFGCQFKGAKSEEVDLVGFHRLGERIELLSGGPDVHRALRHYVSSIAVDRDGLCAGITSSRGGRIVMVDVERRRLIGIHELADVSGVASGGQAGRLIGTSGAGDLAMLAPNGTLTRSSRLPWSWDNHAVSL